MQQQLFQKSNRFLLSAFLAMTAMAIFSSCGNYGKSTRKLAQEDGSYNLHGTEAFTSDGKYMSVENRMGKYDCPFEANVSPSYNYDVNGSRHYKVCTPLADKSVFKVLLHGRPSYGDNVCVFPIQESNPADVRGRIDPSTKKAVVRCFSTAKYHRTPDEGVELSFDGVIFNAALIVDGVDVAAMDYCLRNGLLKNPECPRYSYGKFR